MRENAAILYTAAFPSNTSPIFAWGKLLLWMSDLIATWDTARTDVALFAGPNIVVKSLLFCPFFPDFWILHIYFPSQAFLEAYFSTCGFPLCWLLIRMKVPIQSLCSSLFRSTNHCCCCSVGEVFLWGGPNPNQNLKPSSGSAVQNCSVLETSWISERSAFSGSWHSRKELESTFFRGWSERDAL